MASGAEEAQDQVQDQTQDQPEPEAEPEVQSFRLRVANLDWNTEDENFSNTFSEFKPTEAVIIRRKKNNRSRGYGFVTFSTEDDMNAAMEKLNGTKLDNREIKIQVSTSKGPYPEGSKKPAADDKVDEEEAEPPSAARLIVQRLGWEVDNDQLKESFGEFGEVTSAKVIKNRKSGRSRGYGFVTFENAEDGQKALDALDGNKDLGFTPKKGEEEDAEEPTSEGIKVSLARQQKPRKSPRKRAPRKRRDDDDETKGDANDKPGPRRIFVRDLNTETTEETLMTHYGNYGEVKNVRVIKDRETDESKGFAYVTFHEHEAFSKALAAFKEEEEGATQIEGADIKVVRALPSRAMRGRGGGGRGRGRRRRDNRRDGGTRTGTDL